MSVVGEGLSEFVSKQIDTRQKIYGSINRTPNQLSYLNSRTAFAKLVSSVNISNPEAFQRNPNINSELYQIVKANSGNTLAKRFVLFNGTTNEALNIQRAGIARDGSLVNPNAYGLGGLETGLRAMPGIESVEIQTENRGSLKTGTVRIKAWNRVQFEVLDLLYLRLGFSVLLEWGNNMYFKDTKTLITDPNRSLADAFLEGKLDTNQVLEEIQKRREASCGNYDAIFAKVVNFDWSFAEDGSYNITLKLRSIGDVVESLKLNILNYDKNEDTEEEEPSDDTEEPSIQSYKDKHQLGRILYTAKEAFSGATANQNDANGSNFLYTNIFKGIKEIEGKKHFISQTFEGQDTQYYIRFGSLLAYIENRILPKYNQNSKKTPLINIDTNTKRNIVFYHPLQVSTDPRVCLINTQLDLAKNSYYFASQGDPYVAEIAGTKVGQIMNIYLNFNYLLKKIDEKTDSNNKVALIDFITAVCDDISKSLGSINTLEPHIDETTNTLSIVDQTPLPNKTDILADLKLANPEQQTKIDLYAYYKKDRFNTTGFVRNFGIQTELNSAFSSTITIGAQSAGSVVGEDATALSRLNRGLKDRIKPVVEDAVSTITGEDFVKLTAAEQASRAQAAGQTVEEYKETLPKSKVAELRDRFPNANQNFSKFVQTLGSQNNKTVPKWDDEAINSYTQLLTNFLSYLQGKAAIQQSKASGNIGFIPISLNMTLDGLSGIKIYNALKVDTTYLPANYPESMDFLITGVTHKISSNVWTTDLKTVMVPNTPILGEMPSFSGGQSNNQGAGAAGKAAEPTTRASSRVGNPISISKKRIVEKIINFAKSKGITDRERLTAILTVAQAESGITPGRKESFMYSLERAKAVFPKKLRGLTDNQILDLIPTSKGGRGSEKKLANKLYGGLYGNGIDEGYKYAGKGMTQITFKGNYNAMNNKFKKYNLPYDILKNPEILAQNEDADIALLVIGKIEGQFGNLLNPNINYSTNPAAIIATQDGGKSIPSTAPLEVYRRALSSINSTDWIQDLLG